jgi:hypothetical protein
LLDQRVVDAALNESPTPSAVGRPWGRRLPDVIGVLVVCLVMLAGYYEIPFGGKTFSTASYVANFNGCGPNRTTEAVHGLLPFGFCSPVNENDPRPDFAASSWVLEPSAQVIHRQVAQGSLPLWSEGEGLGMPLAANPQTAALDPLMLAVFLHPTPLVTDLSILFWLLLVAVAAYLFARVLRLRPLPSTVVGVVYGLYGWFFAYSNLWFFRIYLFLPLILAATEWTICTKRRLPVATLGVLLAWAVLVGMPEPTFVLIVAASVFAGARLALGIREGTRRQAVLRLMGGGVLGAALASSLLLPFREYVHLSFNGHAFTGDAPTTRSVYDFLAWMMPRIGTLSPHAAAEIPPLNGSQWLGAGSVTLAAIAVGQRRAMRRHAGWPLVFVFAVIGVQVFGGGLVAWTGHIPVWSQVLWYRWGMPVLALPVALLAGVGLQAVVDGEVTRRAFLAACGALTTVVIVLIVLDHHHLNFTQHVQIRGGWPLAALTLVVIVVAVLWLPSHLDAVVIAVAVILEVLLLAPHGIYADRADPYPSQPWIGYLQSNTQDHSRVFSTDGILFPNISTAYDLSDIRAADALYPERYWTYIKEFISPGICCWFSGVGPPSNVVSNPMFDLLGVRYLVSRESQTSQPSSQLMPQFQPVYHADDLNIYENSRAAPRAFVVHSLRVVPDMHRAAQLFANEEPARFPDGAVRVEHFDPRSSAVVESAGGVVQSRACGADTASAANIVSYSPTQVKISVTNDCPGLLVLSDQYFPGWSATVNGRGAHIYPTDIALRGVPVPAGTSTVEFHYRPKSFRDGLILFALGLVALLVLGVAGLRSSAWWQKRAMSDLRR